MTHDELMEQVKFKVELAEMQYLQELLEPVSALRAVVQLHKPVMQWSGGYDGEENELWEEQCQECSGNEFSQMYPCQTIQAIEKELA